MKEYIIPIEDIIVKPELFYAHCDRGNGKNPEILKEHVDRCYHYFEELWKHKNFKAIFENFQKERSALALPVHPSPLAFRPCFPCCVFLALRVA